MKLKITICLVVIILFSSCGSSLRIVKPYSVDPQKPLEKVALFPVFIGKLKKPIFPLIDAGIFNAKPNDLAPLINQMEVRMVDSIQKESARIISNHLNTVVVSGEGLMELENYKKLKNERNFTENLLTNDPRFPTIHMATGNINPFKFSEGNVTSYFKVENRYKGLINYLCNELNVDGIAIVYTQLMLNNVQLFGSYARLSLYTHFYLFDDRGRLRGESTFVTKGFNTNGKDLQEYELALKDFSPLFDAMFKKLNLSK